MENLETVEFQWILDDSDVTVEATEIIPALDSASAASGLAQNDEGTAVLHIAQNDVDTLVSSSSTIGLPNDVVVEERSLAPMYPVAEHYTGATDFPPIPDPPVNKEPRPVTIVWGFVVMAIGVLAISLAAGAAVDLGLVLVWLPAICGISLILAAVLAATRKNRTMNRV